MKAPVLTPNVLAVAVAARLALAERTGDAPCCKTFDSPYVCSASIQRR